jgi:hypothetical protein
MLLMNLMEKKTNVWTAAAIENVGNNPTFSF